MDLQKLIASGFVSLKAGKIQKEIKRLSAILTEFDGVAPRKRKPRTRKAAGPSNARQRQGRYLGAVAHLTKAQRREIKAIRQAHGFGAAIKAAKALRAAKEA